MIYERFKSNFIYLIVIIVLPLGNMLMSRLGFHDMFMEISYMYLFILLPVILYIVISKKSFKKVLRLNKLNPQQIFIAMILILFIQPLTALAATIMDYFLGNELLPAMEEGMVATGGSNNIFLSLFLIAITPAICEEVFMRGVVLNGYRNIPLWKAAVMNGVLFGLFHNNFMQLSYTTIVGIILTYVVVLTDSIYPAMIMHFIMNGLSVLMENYPNSIYANFTSWYESNIILMIILSIVSIAAVILLIRWLKKISIQSDDGTVNYEQESLMIHNNERGLVTFVEWPLMLATAISIIYSLVM